MSQAAATRYARALAEIVLQSPDRPVDRVAGELQAIDELLKESHDLHEVLLSPAVSAVRKRAVVARIGGMISLSRNVQNFLFVLINHRRIHLFHAIRQAFEA